MKRLFGVAFTPGSSLSINEASKEGSNCKDLPTTTNSEEHVDPCEVEAEGAPELAPDVSSASLNKGSLPGTTDTGTCNLTMVSVHDASAVREVPLPANVEGVDRGVSIQFVLDFCIRFNLWLQATWWVCENIIKPACAAGGPTNGGPCRYVDLPSIDEKGAVGRAKTFVSHAWGAPFGLIVVALLEGEPDMNRHVWIDIFAVLQFEPKPEGELRFDAIIPLCSSFLLVVPYAEEIENLSDAAAREQDMSGISLDTFRLLPMLRVWCLVEIFAALKLDHMVLVMKIGRLQEDARSIGGYRLDAESLGKFLLRLYFVIDVKHSKATVEEDRVRILEEHKDELEQVNSKVRGLLRAALNDDEAKPLVCLVSCAAMGDSGVLPRVLTEPDVETRRVYQRVCAGHGFTALLRMLLDTYPVDDCDKSLLLKAANGGQRHCIQLLLQDYHFDVNATDEHGDSVCINAAFGGHAQCLRLIVETPGCDVNAANKWGNTALTYTKRNGHSACTALLESMGAK